MEPYIVQKITARWSRQHVTFHLSAKIVSILRAWTSFLGLRGWVEPCDSHSHRYFISNHKEHVYQIIVHIRVKFQCHRALLLVSRFTSTKLSTETCDVYIYKAILQWDTKYTVNRLFYNKARGSQINAILITGARFIANQLFYNLSQSSKSTSHSSFRWRIKLLNFSIRPCCPTPTRYFRRAQVVVLHLLHCSII